MKDLLDKVLKFLPQYFLLFGTIFSGPKSFFAHHKLASDAAFAQAVRFVGISLILVQFLQIPVINSGVDVWMYVIGQGVYWLIYVVVIGGGVALLWRLFGGKAPLRAMFVIYAYCVSITTVVIFGVYLVVLAIIFAYQPASYPQFVNFARNYALMPSSIFPGTVLKIAEAVLIAGWVLVFVWSFIAWGAFRHINKASRRISAIVYIILIVFGIPLQTTLGMIGIMLFGKP